MNHTTKQVSVYNYIAPLLVSAVSLFTVLYLALLETSLYIYFVPLCTLSFVVSFILFYRTSKSLKGEDTTHLQAFYHRSFGIFSITLFYFFSFTLVYIPFYYEGGSLFVWWFAPTIVLSLMACIISRNNLKQKPKLVNERVI